MDAKAKTRKIALKIAAFAMILIASVLVLFSFERSKAKHGASAAQTAASASVAPSAAKTRASAAVELVKAREVMRFKLGPSALSMRQDLVFDGEKSVLLFATFATAGTRHSVFGFLNEARETFRVADLTEAADEATTQAEIIVPVYAGQRATYAVRRLQGKAQGGVLFELDAAAANAKRVANLPMAATSYALADTGSPVVVWDRSSFAAVHVSDAKAAQIVYFDARRKLGQVAAPSPGSVAIASRSTPSLLLAKTRPEKRVDVERWEIPQRGGTWQRLGVDPVPYTPHLHFDATPELVCGLASERFSPFFASSSEHHAVFLALLNGRTNPLRFERTKASTMSAVCGACVPLALEGGERGLGLRVAVRRGLATDTIQTPPEFDAARDAASAVASCANGSVLVAYIASGRLSVQRTNRAGGWTFEAARVIAEPTAGERIEQPKLAVIGERLVLVWRRVFTSNSEGVLEFVTSDDGGSSFH